MNIRETIEEGLADTLEDPEGFGLPVILIDPDGAVYGNTEDDAIEGQIFYETVETDEAGNEIMVHTPVVTLRRSSLARVPEDTDRPRWGCRIPITPSRTADKVAFIVEQVSEDGGSIGYISLKLTRAEQASP